MKTSAYIQVTGVFNQTGIDLQRNDIGGELDPHAADNVRTHLAINTVAYIYSN
jgi:hypothetical protein